jgi:hypothetical protein
MTAQPELVVETAAVGDDFHVCIRGRSSTDPVYNIARCCAVVGGLYRTLSASERALFADMLADLCEELQQSRVPQ